MPAQVHNDATQLHGMQRPGLLRPSEGDAHFAATFAGSGGSHSAVFRTESAAAAAMKRRQMSAAAAPRNAG